MRLNLHARDAVVDGQCLERVSERMIRPVFKYEWRDDRTYRGYLATGKAFVAVSLKPKVRIVVAGVRPYARERVLQREGHNPRSRRSIHRLPERAAQTRFSTLPERPGHLTANQPVLEQLLVTTLPNATVVIGPFVINAERTAAGETDTSSREQQQRYEPGDRRRVLAVERPGCCSMNSHDQGRIEGSCLRQT